MSIRLNKALRELNIGLQTAVEFLEKRKDLGDVKAEPSFKLTDQQYKALNDAFSQDREVRDQAEKLFTKKAKDKKRAPEQKDNRAESLLESNGRQQYKPLGKIDLDNIGKKPAAESVAEKPETAAVSPEQKKDAPKAEQKKEQKPQQASQHKQQMKQENHQKSQQSNAQMNKQNVPQGKKEHHHAKNETAQHSAGAADNSVFTLKSEKKFTANEPKVLGKIDLSSLNQSTRPKKKTKEERRKEREEKMAQQHNERKKRVRINKERVDIIAEAKNNGGGNGNNGGNNKKNKNRNRNITIIIAAITTTAATSARSRLMTRL